MAVGVFEGSPIRYNTGSFGATILYTYLKNASTDYYYYYYYY